MDENDIASDPKILQDWEMRNLGKMNEDVRTHRLHAQPAQTWLKQRIGDEITTH
jgi:hypothetical protein